MDLSGYVDHIAGLKPPPGMNPTKFRDEILTTTIINANFHHSGPLSAALFETWVLEEFYPYIDI